MLWVLQSKTHGPVSLSKLREVLKNLEQDKHKQKVSSMTVLEQMTAMVLIIQTAQIEL